MEFSCVYFRILIDGCCAVVLPTCCLIFGFCRAIFFVRVFVQKESRNVPSWMENFTYTPRIMRVTMVCIIGGCCFNKLMWPQCFCTLCVSISLPHCLVYLINQFFANIIVINKLKSWRYFPRSVHCAFKNAFVGKPRFDVFSIHD